MNNSKSAEQRLEDSVEQLKAYELDSLETLNMQKRIKNAVNHAAQLESKTEESETIAKSRFSQFFAGMKSKLVYAGSSAFAVGFIGFMVIMGGTSQTAFAKVQEQLFKVQNLIYQSKMYVQQRPILEISVWYQEPGNTRVETQPLTENAEQAKSINLIDSVNGEGLMLLPGQNRAMKFQFDVSAESDPKTNPLLWFDIVKDYQGEVFNLEQQLVDGQWLNGFLIKESGLSIELWSSEVNDLPTKISIYDGETAETSNFHILGNLSFNQQLDEQLFALDLPEGYELTGADQD